MLCGLAAMMQASGLDGVAFDPFSFQQDGLTASEADVGWRESGDAFLVSQTNIIGDEVAYLGLEIAGQIIVLKQADLQSARRAN